MRILMLAPHPHVRGPLQKHVPHLVAALGELGCSVRVEGWGRGREEETLAERISGRAADIRRIRRVLRAERFEMLVVKTAHDWNTLSRDIPLLLATRGLCRRRVLQFHGCWVNRLVSPGHAAFKLASALLVRFCDAVLVLSTEEQRQWLTFYPRGRVHVVKNPLLPPASPPPPPARKDLGVAEGVPVLLFVGRLMEVKGVWESIAALPEVLARTPCHLVLAGEGAAAEELKRRTAEAGLGSHVTLTGYLEGDALRAAYATADVFVLPSRSEGFPFSILEAMEAGLPVVTTRIRGMADHLREGVNALMIPPRDVGALADALKRILGDAELRARMGRANRDKVREFAPAIVGREYLAILREIADTSPRSAS